MPVAAVADLCARAVGGSTVSRLHDLVLFVRGKQPRQTSMLALVDVENKELDGLEKQLAKVGSAAAPAREAIAKMNKALP